jgi:hypothetical protein
MGISIQIYHYFNIKQMKFSDYENVFSYPRLNRYLRAYHGKKNKALIAYRYNLKLSKEFYGVISIFEILLRNAINKHYQQQFQTTDWLLQQANTNGIFSNLVFKVSNFETKKQISRAIQHLGKHYSHDRLVSSLSFGFWVYLFNALPHRIAGRTLHQIFTNRPKGTLPKDIHAELLKIRDFRNRIAHQEPICFSSNHISTIYAEEVYQLILKYIYWLGFNTDELLFGIDGTEKIINKLKML